MATKCVLSGGGFQDSEGNVLALGYLEFELSQDCSVVGSGNIASGITITVNLDVNGNVAGSPGAAVWGNDVLQPQPNFYKVTGYTAAGQPAWGPNNQQVTGAAFNLGTWVPNTVISWTPTVGQPVTLENNGVPNSSQTTLNLESTDASVTITDLGSGNINLQAGSGGTPSGTNIIPLYPIGNNGTFPGYSQTAPATTVTNSIIQAIPGNSLLCQPTHWKITVNVALSTTFTFTMVKCTQNTGTVLSRVAVTFGGLTSPVLGAGLHTSDSIAFALTTGFDYYLIVNSVQSGTNLYVNGNATTVGGCYVEPSDFTNTSPLTFTGGTSVYGYYLTVGFQSA